MMRRIGIAAAVVGASAVVLVVLVVLNLNRIVAANRDRIVAGISAGFARPVEIERITTGFHGGIALQMDGLRIADDPGFSTDPFLAAARTYVVVRFWPLLRGRVEVRRISVRAPQVTLIRTARGMNVDSLGRRGTPSAGGQPGTPSAPAAPAAIPAFLIALVSLEDGVVRYVDRTASKPSETTITPLSVHLSDLSLTTALRMEMRATMPGTPPTIVHVRGVVGPIGEPPFATDVPIEQHIAIKGGAIEVSDLAVTGRVRRTESGAPIASLRVAAPTLTAGGVEVTQLDVTAAERGGVAVLEHLAFSVFGGRIEGKGHVDHTGASPAFRFETTVRGVDVSQALARRAPDMAERFEGRLDADCAVAGSTGDEALVRRTLSGMGHAAVRNGRLRGVNVADSVLSGVTGVAGLVTLVPSRVRDRYPAVFATEDTVFDELVSDVRLGGERIQLESLTVSARDYAVRGKGVVTFAQQADITATLTASPQLTADVVGVLKEARFLADDTGRLAIPFRMTGVLPNVRPRPDQEFVGRVVRKALVGEGLERLLGGGKREDGRPDGKARPDGSKDALQRGLDKFFGR